MGKCTVPKALGIKAWFDERFGDLCTAHDAVYVNREGSKWIADFELSLGMWDRGYKAIAVGTYVFCLTIGWWYWVKD